MSNYIPLPDKTARNDSSDTIYQLGEIVAICKECICNITEYLVIRILKVTVKRIKNVIVPAHEKFPGDEDFGTIAWSFMSKTRAMKKYEQLKNREPP